MPSSTSPSAGPLACPRCAIHYPLEQRFCERCGMPLVYAGQSGTVLKLLDDLTEAEIAAKLPVQFRHLPETAAA